MIIANNATYNIGQAPALAVFDSSSLGRHYDRYQWFFNVFNQPATDPRNGNTINMSQCQEGSVLNYQFLKAGNWQGILRVTHYSDGTAKTTTGVSVYTFTVIVSADTRKHVTISTAADIKSLNISTANSLYITLANDITANILLGGNNNVLDLNGHILDGNNGNAVTIRGTGNTVTNGTIQNGGNTIVVYGNNTAITNIYFLQCGDCIHVTGTSSGTLIQNCNANLPVGRLLFGDSGCHYVTVVGCKCAGSISESPIRTTYGGIKGLNISYCAISQTSTNGKAGITIRAGSDITVFACKLTGCELSLRTDSGNDPTTGKADRVERSLIKHIDLYSDTNHEAFIRIGGNDIDCVVRNITVNCNLVPAVEVAPDIGIASQIVNLIVANTTRIQTPTGTPQRPIIRVQPNTQTATLLPIVEFNNISK